MDLVDPYKEIHIKGIIAMSAIAVIMTILQGVQSKPTMLTPIASMPSLPDVINLHKVHMQAINTLCRGVSMDLWLQQTVLIAR